MKRILAMLLAILMLVLTLAACSKENDKETTKKSKNEEISEKDEDEKENEDEDADEDEGEEEDEDPAESIPADAIVFDSETEYEPGKPEEKLDPEEIYDQLDYTREMFFGDYRILGGEEGEAAYAEEMSYIDYHYYNYKNEDTIGRITAVPYGFVAGNHTFSHVLNHGNTGRTFMRAYFYLENGYMTTLNCAYSVKGNTLTLNPLAYYEYNQETGRAAYILSETVLEYEFRFEGRKLTLSNGTDEVTLYTGLDVDTDEIYLFVYNYLSEGSPQLNDFDKINLSARISEGDEECALYTAGEGAGNYQYLYAVMEENGLITITMEEDEEIVTRQFVYFYCDDDGLILTDGDTTYYYCADYSDRYSSELGDNLPFEEMSALGSMDEEELEQIIEKKEDLLADLAAAFQEAGIAVTINQETGEIAMDAAVLFPVNEYTVSAEGEALLEQFIGVYNSVVFNEKYDGFVAKIMVEGHTDSSGNYQSNQTLSQNRADSVKALCLQYGQEYADRLAEMMQAVGYSSDCLIFDASGNEDQAASRRVCFRFLINLEG